MSSITSHPAELSDDSTNPTAFSLSQELQQNPTACASNEYVGTPILDSKPEGCFRVYCGNPNGVRVFGRGDDWHEYLEEMSRFQTDALLLYKINLNTHLARVRNLLHDTCRQVLSSYRLITSSSTIASTTSFKPGGTLICTLGSVSTRVITQGADEMGRWLYAVLTGKGDKRLCIVSAYQVCHQEIHSGSRIQTFTASAQQTSLLRQQGRLLSPRQAFVTDLKDFLIQQRELGYGVLLAGDFNKPLQEELVGMTKLCVDLQLSDILHTIIGYDDFATYTRGTTRLDYVLCDGWVAECVIQGCYEPFCYRTKGDHRNMVVDFDTNLLFGSPTY